MKHRYELLGLSLFALLLAGCTAAAGQLMTETPEPTPSSPLIDGYKLSSSIDDTLAGTIENVDNWFNENIGLNRNESNINIEVAHNFATGQTMFDKTNQSTTVFLPGDQKVTSDSILEELLTVNELSTARNFQPHEMLYTENPTNVLLAEGLSTLDMVLYGITELNMSFEDISVYVDNFTDYLPSQNILEFLPVKIISNDAGSIQELGFQILAQTIDERILGSAIYDLLATDIHISDNPSDWASTINLENWSEHMLNERKEIATAMGKLESYASLDLLSILRNQVDNKDRFDLILQYHPEITTTEIIETSEKLVLVGPYDNQREDLFGTLLAFYDGIGKNNHTPKIFAPPAQQVTSSAMINPEYLPIFDATEIVIETTDGRELKVLTDGLYAKFIQDLDSSDIQSIQTRSIAINLDTNGNKILDNEERIAASDQNAITINSLEEFIKKNPELVKIIDTTEWKY